MPLRGRRRRRGRCRQRGRRRLLRRSRARRLDSCLWRVRLRRTGDDHAATGQCTRPPPNPQRPEPPHHFTLDGLELPSLGVVLLSVGPAVPVTVAPDLVELFERPRTTGSVVVKNAWSHVEQPVLPGRAIPLSAEARDAGHDQPTGHLILRLSANAVNAIPARTAREIHCARGLVEDGIGLLEPSATHHQDRGDPSFDRFSTRWRRHRGAAAEGGVDRGVGQRTPTPSVPTAPCQLQGAWPHRPASAKPIQNTHLP